MIAYSKQSLRVGILAVTFGLVLAVVLKIILFPPLAPETSKINNFDYPEAVPLPGWQLNNSSAITLDEKKRGKLNDGHKYEYTKNNVSLEVTTYYQSYVGGNLSRLLNLYKGTKNMAVITGFDYQPGVGFYSTFMMSQKAILTACVNPYGETSVTEQQHAINRYKNGLSFKRTLSWLFGQGELVDSGCLWTFMSMPLQNNSESIPLSQAKDLLQAAWVDWVTWWRPKLTSS